MCFPEISEEFFSNPRSPAGSLVLEKHHREHMTMLIRGAPCDSVKLKYDHFGLLANCLSERYRSQQYLFKDCFSGAECIWLSVGFSQVASAAFHEVETVLGFNNLYSSSQSG